MKITMKNKWKRRANRNLCFGVTNELLLLDNMVSVNLSPKYNQIG